MKLRYFSCLAALALVIVLPVSAHAGTGYLGNGDFEGGALKPWDWFAAGGAKATGTLDTQEKHSGEFSCRIHNESPLEPNVYGQLRQYAYTLKANTTYVITAWVKGNDVSGAQLALGPGWKIIERLPSDTFDWTEVRKEFTTGDSTEKYDIVFLASSTTEALWIDDVKIEEVGDTSASASESSH